MLVFERYESFPNEMGNVKGRRVVRGKLFAKIKFYQVKGLDLVLYLMSIRGFSILLFEGINMFVH